MCVSSHWQILFNIRVFSFACELRTELIFLQIKVSSVFQTLSAHIKENMSNLPKKHVIGQITSWSAIDTRPKMSILTHNSCSFEQTISPSTINTLQKMSILIKDNCLFEQTTSPSTIENLHDMSVVTPIHTRTRKMFIRTNN